MKTISWANRKSTSATSGQGFYSRLTWFVSLCLFPLIIAWDSVPALFTLAFKNDTYSHIPLIPVVSCYLIYLHRDAIFSETSRDWRQGCLVLVPGTIILVLARMNTLHSSLGNRLSLIVLGFILMWVGTFISFFGIRACRAAGFPLLLLLFAIPLPDTVLADLTYLLQKGSAEVTAAIFNLFGVPVFRQGFVFYLPGVSIRVAEECSGIHSTLVLIILTVMAGHFWLRSKTRMLVLLVIAFPVAIIKNAMRIVVLTCLAVYVNPGFLHGNLHRYGGIPFFLLDLLMLGIALVTLRSGDQRNNENGSREVLAASA